jgi:hypothetical protein
MLPMTPWRTRIFAEIDASLLKLGRSTEESIEYLNQTFGCKSRHLLDDAQLKQLNHRLDWEASTLKKI